MQIDRHSVIIALIHVTLQAAILNHQIFELRITVSFDGDEAFDLKKSVRQFLVRTFALVQ
jgi:hypothetical protein